MAAHVREAADAAGRVSATAAEPWWVRQVVRVRTFQSLGNRHYRTLWFGMLASYMAMQMNILARGFLAYDLSKSAAALGIVTMVRGLPQLFLSPLGGVIADRIDKRRLLLYTQSMMGVIAIANVVLIATGLIEVWHLAALSLAEGFVFAFNMPSRQAIVPELVSDEDLANAVALNNSGMNFTRVIGPAVASGLIAFGNFGMELTFTLIALCYTTFVFALYRLPKASERRVTPASKGPFLEQLTGGIKYIAGYPALTMLIGLAFVPVIFGMPYSSFLPVFATDVFHGGASHLGWLSAASGVGALVGSLTVATIAGYRRKDLLQSVFGVLFGAALCGFALTPSFILALGWIFLVGLAGNAYMALNSTMIMAVTERKYLGRVMSVYMMTWSLMPLSTLPVGQVVDMAGVQATIAVCGAIVMLFVVGIGFGRIRRGAEVSSISS